MKPTVTIDSSQRTFKRARKAAQIADASEPRASTIRNYMSPLYRTGSCVPERRIPLLRSCHLCGDDEFVEVVACDVAEGEGGVFEFRAVVVGFFCDLGGLVVADVR